MQTVSKAAKAKWIEVQLNNKPVTLPDGTGRDEATGAEIKAAGIAQGVSIHSSFPLFQVKGNKLEAVGDDETVHIHPGLKFRAVAPDDNS